jgi:chloride channel 7
MDKEENLNNGEDVPDIENDGSLNGHDEEIGRLWSQYSERNMTYEEPLLVNRLNTTSQIAIVGSNLCPIESLDYE